MNTPFLFASLLVALAANATALASAEAQALPNYLCKIERVASADPLPNPEVDAMAKRYVGKLFTIERRTGLMAGALKNSYITRPEVIDHGSTENSYKVVTTLRKEQGVGRGSNAYLLVVNEFHKGAAKPFVFADNDEVFFGTCAHH